MKLQIMTFVAVTLAGCASRTTEEKIMVLDSRIISLENSVHALEGKLSAKEGKYAVRSGDTGIRIARMFDLSFKDLMELNPEADFSRLEVGQVLVISKEPKQAAQTTPVSAPH